MQQTSQLKPGEMFGQLLLGAMADACFENKTTQLKIEVDPTQLIDARFWKRQPGTVSRVRIVVFEDHGPQSMTKEEIKLCIETLQPKHGRDNGFHYSHDHCRVIVVPEQMTFEFARPLK